MIRFDVITLFPDLFHAHLNTLPFKKALETGIVSVNLCNLRNFAVDKRGTVDDKPYGGGVGMILMPEPIFNAVKSIEKEKNSKIIVLSPRGRKFSQKIAEEYSKLNQIILICGRYEGIDERVVTDLSDEAISIGDYVLSGGELPALVVMESITRLLPGVLKKEDAAKIESFSEDLLEFPQYTRPENFKGLKVPDVLLSGNHKEIEKWRKSKRLKVAKD